MCKEVFKTFFLLFPKKGNWYAYDWRDNMFLKYNIHRSTIPTFSAYLVGKMELLFYFIVLLMLSQTSQHTFMIFEGEKIPTCKPSKALNFPKQKKYLPYYVLLTFPSKTLKKLKQKSWKTFLLTTVMQQITRTQ